MPDFRPIFFIAKVLTCCCGRRKPQNAQASNQPYRIEHVQRRDSSSSFSSSDYSEYGNLPTYPGVDHMDLIHPDEFEHPDELEHVHGRDDFGLDDSRSRKTRSLIPIPPSSCPSTPDVDESITSGPTSKEPVTFKPAPEPEEPEPPASRHIAPETLSANSTFAEPTIVEPTAAKSVTPEPIAPKASAPEPVTAKSCTTASVSTETEPEPVESDATKTVSVELYFVDVDLVGDDPRTSGVEASKAEDGITEASSDGAGPAEYKDKDQVSKTAAEV
ncbi:hypothetical protein FBEOM_6240 [Fusarium beomiforme]|uniref:Uncharacterized protein n=1 Tax=Fusarium beomiforme TaxID=44412 RepID=A0A9P5AJP4_9HYPO|nr:hypothetical protein FBEOM_6240 [Fusarium beomiforme]